MKSYLTWRMKLSIVEVYNNEINRKPAARKKNVQPLQICHWTLMLKFFFSQHGMAESKKSHILTLKLAQGSCPRIDGEMYKELKAYYNNVYSMDQIIAVGMLSSVPTPT